jgi:hypothetical protein
MDTIRRPGHPVTHTIRTNLNILTHKQRVSRDTDYWISIPSGGKISAKRQLTSIDVTESHRSYEQHTEMGLITVDAAYTDGTYEFLHMVTDKLVVTLEKNLRSKFCTRCRNHVCCEAKPTPSIKKSARKHISRKQSIPRTMRFARGSTQQLLSTIE